MKRLAFQEFCFLLLFFNEHNFDTPELAVQDQNL